MKEAPPVVALEGIGRVKARALYNAGFTDVAKDTCEASQAKLASVSKIGQAAGQKFPKHQLKKRLGR